MQLFKSRWLISLGQSWPQNALTFNKFTIKQNLGRREDDGLELLIADENEELSISENPVCLL